MSKESLAERVVNNPRIEVYGCGRRDIQTGQIDRRVLATLEFLAASGFKPTVTSLRCGHGLMTASGNVSEHSTGSAVDIAAVNGIPIIGHQGPGSITELTIQRLLTLQGTMKPHQIISLMKFDNTDNTFAMGDHADHIHVGFHSLYGTQLEDRQAGQRDPQAQAVDQAHRPARRDRQPDRAPLAVALLARRARSPAARRTRTRASSRAQTADAVTERRFGFVQWEFAGRLGPDPGRYPVRRFAGDDVREIVVIGGLRGAAPLAAPPRAPRRRPDGRGARAGSGRRHARHGDRRHADVRARRRGGVAGARRPASAPRTVVADALAVLNRAVAAYRVAAADPLLADADPARALVVRVGYGLGEQVAEGEWESARELPRPRERRSRALVPQQRLAALLSGRDVALACEELALRARGDLDAGRQREAAMQLHLALEAAVAELESWRGRADMGERIDELAGLRDGVAAAANAAIQGGLEPADVSVVVAALWSGSRRRCGRARRARPRRDWPCRAGLHGDGEAATGGPVLRVALGELVDVLGDGGGEVAACGGALGSSGSSLYDGCRTVALSSMNVVQDTDHIAQPARAEIELAAVLHALSDPVRLRIVAALAATGERAVVRELRPPGDEVDLHPPLQGPARGRRDLAAPAGHRAAELAAPRGPRRALPGTAGLRAAGGRDPCLSCRHRRGGAARPESPAERTGHLVVAGVVAAVVAWGGAFAVVLAGLTAVGATDAEAASGLLALSVGMGVLTSGSRLRERIPVTIAWSTPGAALLVSAGAVEGGWPAAVGAFAVTGALLALAGLWRPLGTADRGGSPARWRARCSPACC